MVHNFSNQNSNKKWMYVTHIQSLTLCESKSIIYFWMKKRKFYFQKKKNFHKQDETIRVVCFTQVWHIQDYMVILISAHLLKRHWLFSKFSYLSGETGESFNGELSDALEIVSRVWCGELFLLLSCWYSPTKPVTLKTFKL